MKLKFTSLFLITLLTCCKQDVNMRNRYILYINHFYTEKSNLMNSHEVEYWYKVKLCWDSIMLNRDSVLFYLMKYELKTTSYELYGKEFIPYVGLVQKMPDNVHALYLIEAISRNDYLFNRHRFPMANLHEQLENDGLNFLYTYNKIDFCDTIYYLSLSKETQKIWNKCNQWYKEYEQTKKMKIMPLNPNNWKWNRLTRLSDSIFYTDSTQIWGKLASIDSINFLHTSPFQIGRGWKNDTTPCFLRPSWHIKSK